MNLSNDTFVLTNPPLKFCIGCGILCSLLNASCICADVSGVCSLLGKLNNPTFPPAAPSSSLSPPSSPSPPISSLALLRFLPASPPSPCVTPLPGPPATPPPPAEPENVDDIVIGLHVNVGCHVGPLAKPLRLAVRERSLPAL
ncbi:hypothetical protein BC937DRAFT_93830 [Endogone sp. FLAS-F59071]|nr:hypothetical protein BC937DRAFT_93830 [Endogone sp. FLAS-F59071]|eukprot:RUS21010.1 hypothetical protein BC937DRAFT_93830 [Endogone sp. FLAS-F59071]